MTEADRLERDLAAWLDDTAMPSVPDDVSEIVREATRHRQRPRWTFVERWWPAWNGVPRSRRSRRIAWSPVVVVLIALILLLAAVAAFIGSRQRVPPPFGPADNGLIAFERGGEILTFDPSSGIEVPLLTGFDIDVDPTWSLDGTRVAFVRQGAIQQGAPQDVMGFIDRDGGQPIVGGAPLGEIDSDSVVWSPNGREVALSAGPENRHDTYFVDAFTGAVSRPPLLGPGVEPYWRPPNGRELMYVSTGPEPGLRLYSLDDDSDRLIVSDSGIELRPRGWSPDGVRFVYATTTDSDDWFRTRLIDVATSKTVDIDAGPGRLSNDGMRVVAYRLDGERFSLCLADAAGGPCVPIDGQTAEPDPTHGDALNWSPDDEWVITYSGAGGKVVLVDPDGIDADVRIPADGAGSWQRSESD